MLYDFDADFIKMQLELNDFMERYKHLFPGNDEGASIREPEENESLNLLNQTVNGKLKFDSAHPQYDNPRFFQELFNYYERHENYEMCEKLLKIRKL